MAAEIRALGELEAQVMDVIWDLEPPISTTQVFKIMYPQRELSYSTVMLTMAKLARKGLLTQTRSGEQKTAAFHYGVKITREEMARQIMEHTSRMVMGKSLVEAVKQIVAKAP